MENCSFVDSIQLFGMGNGVVQSRNFKNSTKFTDETITAFAAVSSDEKDRKSFTKQLRPALTILKLFGFVPFLISADKPKTRTDRSRFLWYRFFGSQVKTRKVAADVIYGGYCIGLLCLSAWTFREALNIINNFRVNLKFHFLHAMVIVPVITACKPLILGFQFLFFGTRVSHHRTFLASMNFVAKKFEDSFGTCTSLAFRINLVFVVSVSLTLATVVSIMTAQFILLDTSVNFMTVFQVLLIPLQTVWNFLPLLYWDQMQKLFQFWSSQLKKNLVENFSGPCVTVPKKSVRYFYERFNDYCNLQLELANLLNVYLGFTLIWALFHVCFGVYFVVNVEENFTQPPEWLRLGEKDGIVWDRMIYFNMFWLLLQIAMAIVHIAVILNTGRITNEETRAIVNTVLSALNHFDPEPEDHLWVGARLLVTPKRRISDLLQINQFTAKLHHQSCFGASANRAFLFERGSFVRFATLIASYAIILIRLKPAVTVLAGSNVQDLGGAEDVR